MQKNRTNMSTIKFSWVLECTYLSPLRGTRSVPVEANLIALWRVMCRDTSKYEGRHVMVAN